MRCFLFVLLLGPFLSLRAQYYFNDIIGTMEQNRQMRAYALNKVRMVTAAGFDQNGVKATDFAEVQEIKETGRALKITSRNSNAYNAYYHRFDDQFRLVSTDDSSTAVQSITTYQYDVNGRITRVQNVTRDTANDFNQTEVHEWIYNTSGQPEKMWRIINNSDSLEIRFGPDDAGNTGEERTYRKGNLSETVYYYYDEKRRLTDVVRYNTKFKRLMPDIMFEYDDSDRVIQKITTTSSLHLGYLIWRYVYDGKGLKTKEALFDDKKQLTGKIEYTYSFGQ